ncbi:hypothetical protein IMCC26134_07995 [Verrucomicrobia bacterium IMCC26134]|jgi:glycosyltransferase involved in cell wall biosynthesis|nr:hypothetical protein IMCC26134_07995 [Verrucomicrobia bacterium IMCC26134]
MTSKKRPRIAFVSLLDNGSWGASEYLWSETARLLVKNGHEVIACIHGGAKRPPPLDRLSLDCVSLIERFPPRGARLRDFVNQLRHPGRVDTMQAQAIGRVLRHQPDLVLISCTWATNPGLAGWCEHLQTAGIRYAVLIHTHVGHWWPLEPSATRLGNALAKAESVYFVSEDNREMLVRQLGLPVARTSVVRNPLAIDRDTAPPWPSGPEARLACVGRLDPAQKGQDILLACLHDARWRDRSVTVGFFGEGPARDRLGELATGLRDGLVTFHGHVDRPASIWETHHLLVFPSRFEGLGLVVAEAQLCGRPVLITDCAARELVIDGETGFIAASATVPALQAALDRAWSRRADWPQMGAAARQHMLKLLPPDPVGDFAQALRTLCAS